MLNKFHSAVPDGMFAVSFKFWFCSESAVFADSRISVYISGLIFREFLAEQADWSPTGKAFTPTIFLEMRFII